MPPDILYHFVCQTYALMPLDHLAEILIVTMHKSLACLKIEIICFTFQLLF